MNGLFLKEKYNRDTFTDFLSQKFLPSDFEQSQTKIITTKDNKVIKDAIKLGICPSLELSIYEFRHNSKNDPRVMLSRESYNILSNNEIEPHALAVFFNEDNSQWRLSLITSDYILGKKKGQVKREFSNPRRFSYLLGEGCKLHTPESMLVTNGKVKSQEDLVSRFAIEVLTKEFYDRLFNWYKWALDIVRFPEGSGDKTKLTANNNEIQLIRLITRLIFVWFIKQKHLIPDWLFDCNDKNKNSLPNILTDFSPDSSEKGSYYNAILQNLFFATLNREILNNKGKPNREFTEHDDEPINSDYAISYKYRDNKGKSFFNVTHDEIIKLFEKIPFLNGGLFECLDSYIADGKDKKHGTKYYKDGFSREKKRRAFVPDCLFWNKDKEHEGIIHILSEYNFTVEENTPSDIEVSLDPELLGKVFENLLGYLDPDTNKMARNASGSFYTPREIVSYMVDESLINHIKTKIKNLDEKDIRSLFDDNTTNYSSSIINNKKKLVTCLKEIRILDPACGSGAFPMGILNRLTELIQKIEDINTREEIYNLKIHLIEKCIYGIDIQPIAVQIAKLRFFVSLICEQERNENINENYGIKPLPNLETKFVAANSLLGLSESSKENLDFDDEKLKSLKIELWNIRKCHFYAKDSDEKKGLQRDDENKRNEIMAYLLQKGSKPDENRIAHLKKEIEDLQQKRISVEQEMLVDECEPQNDLDFGIKQSPKNLFQTDINKPKRDTIDREIKIKLSEISKEQNKTNNLGDFEKAIRNIATWNPYDQNNTSEFFDSVWMFGLNNYFDIVIGNPPYVSTKGVSAKEKIEYEKEYGFSDDTYNHFFFKGCSLLKDEGILTYISPKTFWTIQTKRNLRELLLSKKIIYIFDTANPFKAAMVDTCITSIQNISYSDNNIHFLDGSKDLINPHQYFIPQNVYSDTQNMVIFKPTQENLKIFNLYGKIVKELYIKWWDKISTSKNIEKHQVELEEYRKSLKPGDIALLGCLTEGGQGLATANNGKYIAVRKSTKWAKNIIESRPKKLSEAIKTYKIKIPELSKFTNTEEFLNSLSEKKIADLFDSLKEKYGRDIFGQGYIYKLIDDDELADIDKLTDKEKANGISTSKKYYVPYDKGDKDGNRWYLETPFAIAWSKENVQYLKTNSGKKGIGMPVMRNMKFYFKDGFCWTDVNSTYLKARIKGKCVYDVLSMSLFSQINLPDWYFVTLINSKFISFYVDNFINNTSHFQINDARQLPIIIPTKEELKILENIFNNSVASRKKQYTNITNFEIASNELLIEQERLDDFLINLYNI